MSVAKNIEISSTSTKSFEDAVNRGIQRASRTIKNIRGAWIKEQKIEIEGGNITEYHVAMILTFVLDEGESVGDDEKNKKTSKNKAKKK